MARSTTVFASSSFDRRRSGTSIPASAVSGAHWKRDESLVPATPMRRIWGWPQAPRANSRGAEMRRWRRPIVNRIREPADRHETQILAGVNGFEGLHLTGVTLR